MARNLITDVAGLRVGHADDHRLASGSTVILFDEPAVAGVDVRGYLYWTAWDNFEWAAGYTQRFGLIAVDRDTLERIPKPSAALYAEICRTREVPDADSIRVT
jgi:hypothetical protein